MANSFTAINDAQTNDAVIGALTQILSPLSAFSTAFSDRVAQSINVPIVTARTATTGALTTLQDGNTTVASKVVTFANDPIRCSFHMTEKEQHNAGNPQVIWNGLAMEAAKAVAIEVQNTAFNVVTASTYGNTANTHKRVVASGSLDADEALEIRRICRKTKKIQGPISILLDTAYLTGLLADPAVRDASASGNSSGADGIVRRWAGFDIYENNQIALSTPGSGGENLLGIACDKSAILVGCAPYMPQADGAYLEAFIVTDPVTGFSMGYRRWIDTDTGYMWGSYIVDCMAVEGRTGGLLRLVTA